MTAAVLEDLDWSEDAIATIVGLAHSSITFSAEDLGRELRKPPHPNMVGAAFVAAKSLGYIKPIGYQISTTKSRHHGVIRTWTRRTDRKDTSK